MTALEQKMRSDALLIAQAALAAADAGAAVARNVRLSQGRLRIGKQSIAGNAFDRVFTLAVGKAAVTMAAALEEALGSRFARGLAVTKHGHAERTLVRTEVLETGHPIPDEQGLRAGKEVTRFVRDLNERDLLLLALSGGASALLPAPVAPITLVEKQTTTNLLLQCGATIGELNQVRKHISALKGGQLAALSHPATVISLVLSDVVGDRLDVIGSGLTAPDLSTFADALDVLARYSLLDRVPAAVREHLQAGLRGDVPETPKPGDPAFDNVTNLVIGSNRLALKAASRQAKQLGYKTAILTSGITGESRDVAAVHAAILQEIKTFGSPLRAPACLLSGGETTVTIRGQGKGGRNQEFALAAALALDGLPDALVLSLGTDGTDGPTDAAGALVTGTTLDRARALALDPARHLAENNAYPFFAALDDLVKTGPTGTNVMDIHLLLAGA